MRSPPQEGMLCKGGSIAPCITPCGASSRSKCVVTPSCQDLNGTRLRLASQFVEPPTADPHDGWCGAWELETPGYPIRQRLAQQSALRRTWLAVAATEPALNLLTLLGGICFLNLPCRSASFNKSPVVARHRTTDTIEPSAPKGPPVNQVGPVRLPRSQPSPDSPETAIENTAPCTKFQARCSEVPDTAGQ